MRSQPRWLAAFAIAIVVTGCATPSDEIPPAFVSAVPYMNLDCQEMGERQAQLAGVLTAASARQDDARTYDTVGVLLIGLPVGSLFGENRSAKIAQLKGQQLAIERAAKLKSCLGKTS